MTRAHAGRNPSCAELVRLGQGELRRGRLAEARRSLQAAVAADPHDERAWVLLARLSAPRARLAYLARALELNHSDPLARAELRRARRAGLRPRPPAPAQTTAFPLSAPALPAHSRWVAAALVGGSLFAVLAGLPVRERPTLAAASLPGPLPVAEADTPAPVSELAATATLLPAATATALPPTPVATATAITLEAPAASPVPLARDPAAIGSAERWIDIDLTTQTLTAFEGTAPVASFTVSTGRWPTPTVTGQYRVYVKYAAADMSGPGYYLASVPYVMYFYQGYGIHGTYWHDNFGTPMSHGCVNMRTDEAAWIFDWSAVGTLVNVHH